MNNTSNQVYVWCCKYAKKNPVKDMPINNQELLKLQDCSFQVFWNRGCTQSLVASCKYWIVHLISTRCSGYSQVILLVSRICYECPRQSIYRSMSLLFQLMTLPYCQYWNTVELNRHNEKFSFSNSYNLNTMTSDSLSRYGDFNYRHNSHKTALFW